MELVHSHSLFRLKDLTAIIYSYSIDQKSWKYFNRNQKFIHELRLTFITEKKKNLTVLHTSKNCYKTNNVIDKIFINVRIDGMVFHSLYVPKDKYSFIQLLEIAETYAREKYLSSL